MLELTRTVALVGAYTSVLHHKNQKFLSLSALLHHHHWLDCCRDPSLCGLQSIPLLDIWYFPRSSGLYSPCLQSSNLVVLLFHYCDCNNKGSSLVALNHVRGTGFSMGDDVQYAEEFLLNSRGSKLLTCRWLPLERRTQALVFLCHGYGMECSIFMRGTGLRLAQAGYAVFGIDYEGHGRSEGRRCYIQSFSDLVTDCVTFFKSVREIDEYKNLPRFLYGESMGGAVALLIHRREPLDWNGAILVAPMCKISREAKTHPLVESILIKLCSAFPTWKIIPTKDVIELAFKDPTKRQEIRENPYVYQDRPRLKTGLEMLKVSLDLEQRLDEVTFPFLVLHGEADVVTDPAISKALFDSALSFDKELKLYAGMWHGLTSGEPDDNIQTVFQDIICWLDDRSSTYRRRDRISSN